MFRGIHLNTVDAKGRTSIPAKFRDAFMEVYGDERFFITNSGPVDLGGGVFGRGLTIYPSREWLAFEEKVSQAAGFTAAQLNSIRRLVMAPAVECAPDRQGRVLVPPHLREAASLERDVVFVGSLKKIEIWSQVIWGQVVCQAEKDFPSDTAALADLGL